MPITLVKSDAISAAAGASGNVEVDLGLGIDEAARIVGIELDVRFHTTLVAATDGYAMGAYSFDPEDTTIAETDDEQFAEVTIQIMSIAATTGAANGSFNVFKDFSHMNLITTRNLALVGYAFAYDCSIVGKVYYEKYKPTSQDLVELIAHRR